MLFKSYFTGTPTSKFAIIKDHARPHILSYVNYAIIEMIGMTFITTASLQISAVNVTGGILTTSQYLMHLSQQLTFLYHPGMMDSLYPTSLSHNKLHSLLAVCEKRHFLLTHDNLQCKKSPDCTPAHDSEARREYQIRRHTTPRLESPSW